MAPEQTSEIIGILEETRREFHDAASGLAEAQAIASPAHGRWSVLQCVEHVANVEQRFLGRLQNAARVEAPSIDKQREANLLARVADRSQRAEAPEPVRPSGRFANLASALEAFDAARAETMRFAQARSLDLYFLDCEHPRFGPLNGYEFLLIVAGHARRHALQIRETRAALGGA